jgi:thiol:disulfide interchange protein DsbD
MVAKLPIRVFQDLRSAARLGGVSALALLWCVSGAEAQPAAPAHAKINLVVESNSVDADGTAWMGVLFDLERGWHIYWVNPGDAGEAPHIEWKLPTGFRAGDIQWPVPARISTGPLIDYGYEGQVLLAAPLHVPAAYKPGTLPALTADVRYVICREVCIPAETHLMWSSSPDTSAPADAAARRELFRHARERWPKPLPAGWEIKASDNGREIVLAIQTGRRETMATFFPLNPDEIDNAASQMVVAAERGAQLTIQKSDPQSKPLSVLKGIIVLAADRGFAIAAPVAARR